MSAPFPDPASGKSHVTSALTGFNKRFPSTLYIIKWLAICSVTGVCIGSASAFFLVSLDWATRYRESHSWVIWLLPAAGFLIGLLYHYFGKEVESGNNLLIDTIHDPKDFIRFRMAPFVLLGTVTTHLFGGSAGREGTALQMAGAIGEQFSKWARLNTGDRKIVLISAISAGFGSVFGTPLAGAVFGLEVFVIGRLKYDAIFPAFASAIIASLVTDSWQVEHTHYHIPDIPRIAVENLLFAVLAGIAFGIAAAAFSKAIHFCSALLKSRIAYPPLRPVLGGIIVMAGVWLIGTRYIGLGIPVILSSFTENLPPYDFAWKAAFTIITLSAGFKGGEVTPLFFIGATLGNALSYFIPLPTGLLAGMGFVAVFAGATNTPLACILMGMELFGSECGIFVAIACAVSYLLSGHTGIYKSQIIGEPKNASLKDRTGRKIYD